MAVSLNGILFVVGVIVLGFLLYVPLRDRFFNSADENEGFDGNYAKKHSMPGRGPIEILPASYSPPKTVAQSGPNPPAQAAPEGEVVIHADPAPRDPYAEEEERSTASPKMTYPERSFRPAPANDQDGLAYESGIAGPTAQNSPQAYQKFGLDMVQNSGEFYNGIYANDTYSDTNYSTF
jgi:hypothetical protein